MTSTTVFLSPPVQTLLQRLHAEAEAADTPLHAQMSQMPEAQREALQSDHKRLYHLAREAFLSIGEAFGRILYLQARAIRARTIFEFGTSFGISTIYLAAALRDNGGGRLVTYEWEPAKSRRAQAHLAEAGLSDLVEFRVGDALELMPRDVTVPVDLLFLDGAKPLYLPVLKLVEPVLKPGALIAADNISSRHLVGEFTAYIREPANGYISVQMPLEDEIELSVRL